MERKVDQRPDQAQQDENGMHPYFLGWANSWSWLQIPSA